MRAELPVLSFLCLVCLLGFAPLHWKSRNVAMLGLIAWLLVCSLVQGVNSIIWAGNTIIRIPVWCDIVTRLLLGARVAVPAACTCICYHLYYLSSNCDGKQRRHRMLCEGLSCIAIPIVYIALYTDSQDRRFDLVKDFGCAPSIYISAHAVILVWLPPTILCITTFIFAALALWSHFRLNPHRTAFSPHFITLTFLRPLFTALTISSIVLATEAFNLYARITAAGGLQPYTTGSDSVHNHFTEVNVLAPSATREASSIEVTWWAIPASSMVFIVMSSIGLVCGAQMDTLNGIKSIKQWFNSWSSPRSLVTDTISDSEKGLPNHLRIQSPTQPTAVYLPQSGWDDTLKSSGIPEKTKTRPPPISCEIPVAPSSPSDSEASFILSTLTYLESPTGREALGLPPIHSQLPKDAPSNANQTVSPASAPMQPPPASPTHSILAAPWPRPPAGVPVSPHNTISHPASPARHDVHTASAYSHIVRPSSMASITTSLASSTISTHAYAHDPGFQAPFVGSGIPTMASAQPKRARLMRSKDGLSAKLSLRGRERREAEGVFMTVVQETV